MRKWGHKEGTGLGADGTGIKHALTAEHVAKPIDPKQPLSKRQLAKQKAANANAKSNNKKWVMHSTNRGKIVNANEEGRRQEEQGKYGQASRVICLVGLVGSEDEIDEDLSEGEECSKYGYVYF
jgi:splicing factor 45